jgi:hypothetical protein
MAFTVTRYDYTTGQRVESRETLGVGTTLFSAMETVQVMSDIWESQLCVTYWDAEAGAPKSMYVTEGVPNVIVDYTPEVLKAYIAQQAKLQYTNVLERLESAARKDFQKVVPGATVKVTGGKQKPGVTVGKEYKVFHVMERSYGMGYRASMRPIAGIALDEEMHDVVGKNGRTYQSYKNVAWVWCHNMEVVGAEAEFEKYMPTMIAQAKQAMTARVTELLNKFSKQQKAA